MLRKLLLCLVIALTATSAVASSLSVPLAPPAAAGGDELAGRSVGDLIHQGMRDPRFEERMRHWLADHGLDHPQRLDTGGLSPIEVAQAKLGVEKRAGRTVEEWVRLARAENLLGLPPSAAPAEADLVEETARLAAAYGLSYSPAQLAGMRAQADVMPAELRGPLAALVAALADVTLAQAPVADAVVARVDDGDLAFMLTAQEREATLAHALELVAAQNAFRDAVDMVELGHHAAAAAPVFRDPLGLVVVGSTADDTFRRDGAMRDAALLVDLGGNDVYEQLAGGACPDRVRLVHDCNGLVAALSVDLAGDDRYVYRGRPTNPQGSGSLGGIGVLVDAAGADSYLSDFVQPTSGLGALWGGVLGYIDAGSQGYGLAGVGILLDAAGNDVYEADITTSRYSAWVFAQGFGNAGGVGIASDGIGDDAWLSYGFESPGLGGFQGLYPGGTGFFGGLGVMTDTGLGNDEYHAWDSAITTDFYAYGFGAFGGTGIFYEEGGDDNYEAVESASNPWIVPLLNCAYGTASFAGLGAFLEMGGNDRYFGDSISPRQTATMNEGFGGPAEGEGVFLDVSGDDGHFMEAHSAFVNNYEHTYGRGALLGGGEGLLGNTVGVYLDLAGNDAYTGASPSRNNAVWPAGLDLEAGSVPGVFIS